MLERKRLVYGDGEIGKPAKKRILAYTGIALVFGACATANAIPEQRYRPAETARVRQVPEVERACRPDLHDVLHQGEVTRETVCRDGREYVLTNTSLIIIEHNAEEPYRGLGFRGEPSIQRYFTRTDMGDIYARGLVDWEAGRSACYFLTADRGLTVYPNTDMGDTVPSYTFTFETRDLGRNGMVYHSGFVFIAAPGESVIAFGEDGQRRTLDLVAGSGHGFGVRDGRLFLGSREIVVRGPAVEDLMVKR
jgi:hypothetical protein